MTVLVRPATPDDVPAAADVHGGRLGALHRLYLSAVALPFGRVDVGETPEGLVSVAVWVPGTAVPEDVWTRVGPAAAELAGGRGTAGDEAEATLAGYRLEEPHVALVGLGVVPSRQGRGRGAAAPAPGLARARRGRPPV